ncbi:unnamed protein product, partial [Cuscuta epithymum]
MVMAFAEHLMHDLP